jgi:pimeloyl-ACP methyl ester carboxylesterase/class 3 adenylate cyclase
MDPPETRYARSGDVSIAYQVLGEGPVDVVLVPGMISNVDYDWHEPRLAAFRRRLGRASRSIVFDKRGTGLSDHVRGVPTLEERMDDVRAVMDAAGSERAVVLGISEGGAMAVLFGATYPERAAGVILYGAYAHAKADPQRLERMLEELPRRWGTREYAEEDLRLFAPSVAHEPELQRFWATWVRFAATPAAAADLSRMNAEIDVRHVLPTLRVPTLLLHRSGDRVVPLGRGQELAAAIPNARLVELPGTDHYPYFEQVDGFFAEVEGFVRGVAEEAAFDRVLSTVLFTDIVGSTERAVELGDRRWRELLEEHHALVRAHLGRFRGREIDTAGDGFFASFDGPARAVRCARSIVDSVRELGLEVRAGLHTGECELSGDRLRGLAVHIGARVAATAGPGEVVVSATVKDLVAGSGIVFDDRGEVELKGVPGAWRLFSVASA